MLDRMALVALASALVTIPALAVAADAHDSGHGAHHHGPSAPASKAGKPGDPRRATRTIEVRMGDNMRFDPAKITVHRGDTVRFRVTNAGKLQHEMVIGTRAELKAHAMMMRQHAQMQHDQEHNHAVAPGGTQEIVWHFGSAGQFQYACLIAGHFEAGMVGDIEVR